LLRAFGSPILSQIRFGTSLSTKDPRDEELSYFTSFVSTTLTFSSFEFFSTPSNTPPQHHASPTNNNNTTSYYNTQWTPNPKFNFFSSPFSSSLSPSPMQKRLELT